MRQTTQIAAQIHEYLDNRRAKTRFKVKNGVYAVTAGEYSLLGPVTNISMGGMAFNYINQEFKSLESIDLCIIIPESDFMIQDIPVKTIYDYEIVNDFHSDFIVMRRRGVSFEGLSQDQKEQMFDFIKCHTRGSL